MSIKLRCEFVQIGSQLLFTRLTVGEMPPCPAMFPSTQEILRPQLRLKPYRRVDLHFGGALRNH